MEQYENLNSFLTKIDKSIGAIRSFDYTSVYLFITTAIVLSSAISIGAIRAIGLSLAPLVYGAQMFYMLIFWISAIMVLIVVARNMIIALYMNYDGEDEDDDKSSTFEIFTFIYSYITKERPIFSTTILILWVVFLTTMLAYTWVNGGIGSLLILLTSLACIAFTAIIGVSSRGRSRYKSILFTYVFIISFCYLLGYTYVITIRDSDPNVIISLVQPPDEIKARILLATKDGILVYVNKEPQFYTWENLRKIVKLEWLP